MQTLISANEWPVFDSYGVTVSEDGFDYIGPSPGAQIREIVDLLDPATRNQATDAAVRILKNRRLFSLDDVLGYVERFGLLGLGPAQLIEATHFVQDAGEVVRVHRRTGKLLRSTAADSETPHIVMDRHKEYGERHQILPAPGWSYVLPGHDTEEMFSYLVGTPEWWALYAEPIDEMLFALLAITEGPSSHLEAWLGDTFVALPSPTGDLHVIERFEIGWRSISAIGALALAVVEGGLRGYGVCHNERCQQVYKQSRRNQRFCKPTCRAAQHEREKYQRNKGPITGR